MRNPLIEIAKQRRPATLQEWNDKDPYRLKGSKRRAWTFCSPSSTLYEQIILKQD